MDCIKCRKPLPDGALYCPNCGKKQSAEKRVRRPKRSHAAGSIVKLSGPRNRPWLARLPEVISGGKIERPILGCYATYKEADAALREALVNGHTDKATLTLGGIYQQFTASNYFAQLSKQGQDSHRKAWKYLMPWAETRISALSTAEFQAAADAMRDKGLKRETIAKVRNLASLLCKECIRMGLLDINYGQLVQLPREDKTAKLPFSLAELIKIWTFAETGEDKKDLQTAWTVLTLCYTGMRPGELLGVELQIHIKQFGGTLYFYTGSKTTAGRNRIIPIPTVIRPFVESLAGGRSSGPLVSAPAGGPWRVDNWRKRAFKPLMDHLGIENATPYTGRHTYADLQKRRDVDPEIMMEIMGHEDYSTTVEHYHTTTDEDISRICQAVQGLERPDLLATNW